MTIQSSLKSLCVFLCVLVHCSFNRLAHIFVYPPFNPLPCSKAYRAAQSTSNQHAARLLLLSYTPVHPAAGSDGISSSAHAAFAYIPAYDSTAFNLHIYIQSIYFWVKVLNVWNKKMLRFYV